MAWGWGWRPYVPVAQRRAKAFRTMERLRKKGANIQPVRIEGREIARSFWGQAWCVHLEKFSDFANRLPRGRTYVRNGSVCHLDIRKGGVAAKVSGSEIYDVSVKIKTLPGPRWKAVKEACAGRVGSMLELLQGRLSNQVMGVVTDAQKGLFPRPQEMDFDCSCPDWADMCKHVAAVLYGVGARLDEKPDLLFLLRGVDHAELVGQDAARAIVTRKPKAGGRVLDEGRLSEVFGIEVAGRSAGKAAGRKAASRATTSGPPKGNAPTVVTPRAAIEKPHRRAGAAPSRRGLSPQAKRRITAAQKARWASHRARTSRSR